MDRYSHMPAAELLDEPFVSEHPHQWVHVPARARWECGRCEATAPVTHGRHSKCEHEWMETPNRIWVCTRCGAQQQR